MTVRQLAYLARFPHMRTLVHSMEWAAREAEKRGGDDAGYSASPCIHRGKVPLDVTACQCTVYSCKIHGVCSPSPRADLMTCPCESYQAEDVPPA